MLSEKTKKMEKRAKVKDAEVAEGIEMVKDTTIEERLPFAIIIALYPIRSAREGEKSYE